MHANRFGNGRIHRRFICPGSDYNRRRRGKKKGTEINDKFITNHQAEEAHQNHFAWLLQILAWLLHLCLAAPGQVIFLIAAFMDLVTSILVYFIKCTSFAVFDGLLNYHLPSFGQHCYNGSTGPLHKLFGVMLGGIMPLFIVSNNTASELERKKHINAMVKKFLLDDIEQLYDMEDVILRETMHFILRKKKISRMRKSLLDIGNIEDERAGRISKPN